MSAGRLVRIFERGEWTAATAAGGRVQRLRAHAARTARPCKQQTRMSIVQTACTTRAALDAARIGTVAGLLVALALMVGFFSWQSEYFLTADTFITIANHIPDRRGDGGGHDLRADHRGHRPVGGLGDGAGRGRGRRRDAAVALAAAARHAARRCCGGAGRRRDQRRGDGGVADSVVHRHAGHAGDGARRGLRRHRLAHAVHRRRDRLARQADRARPVAGVLHRDRDRRGGAGRADAHGVRPLPDRHRHQRGSDAAGGRRSAAATRSSCSRSPGCWPGSAACS